jgi:hypothetical protein
MGMATEVLVQIGESVFSLGTLEPGRCTDFDESCVEIVEEDYVLRCWLYDPARGRCPFVGD